MLLKKTAWFWKSGLAAISFMLIVSVSGCSDTPQEETAVVETISEVQLPGQLLCKIMKQSKHSIQITWMDGTRWLRYSKCIEMG